MVDEAVIKKIKEKIGRNEAKLKTQMGDVERLWEDTGLDPKDQSYLVEKTMRFEMAQASISKVFSLFNETVEDYKRLCTELEGSDDS